MATIQDVAKQAQVGKATVSRVLSGKGYVKESTREKVLRVIEELDYTPNEAARNLFYNKTNIVAVIVPEVSHPFFAEFLSHTETALTRCGYQAMICNTWCEQNYELRCLEMLKQRRVDGIIFAAHSLNVEQYEGIDRPIVALDRVLNEEIPCVAANHREGGRLAAEELIRSGCKNVLQFRDNGSVADTPSNLRHDVFETVMQEHHIPCYSFEMDWNTFGDDYYKQITEHILEEHPDVDGVFGTDEIIMSVLQSANQLGRKVPQDLKLIAYDGTRATRFASPSLTMIVQPMQALAEQAVSLMIQMIQGKGVERGTVVLPVTLQKGGST